METMCYITLKPEEQVVVQGATRIVKKTGKWIAIIHHERMDYYDEQTTLENVLKSQKEQDSRHPESVTELDERTEDSKDNACV